jgi:hypothetical protein
LQDDESVDALALDGVGEAHDGGFGYGRVGNQGALYIRCAEAMAGDFQDIVYPP